MRRRSIIICSAFIFAGCATYAPTAQESRTEEVRAALLSFAEAMNAGDLDQVADMYADLPSFYWIESGALRYQGKEEAVASLEALAESGMRLDVTYTDIKITSLGPRSAIASAIFETVFSHPSGREFQFNGVQTTGMILTENGWKIASGHTEGSNE